MIKGRGVLVCADKETPASYSLELSNDAWGTWIATGFLNDVDLAFASEAYMSDSICRLRLEDSEELLCLFPRATMGALWLRASARSPISDSAPIARPSKPRKSSFSINSAR